MNCLCGTISKSFSVIIFPVTRHFSGSLPRYREIDDMLKVIEKTSHVRFEVKGKTIIVD